MAKRYVFGNPEQLKAIAELSQEGSACKIRNVAKVWSATLRQKGKTPWDGKIGVFFHSASLMEGRKRRACVFLRGTDDAMQVLGWLKYSVALNWCEEHMERAD